MIEGAEMSVIVSCEQLREITGYKGTIAIAKCLRKQNIPFFYSKNGPWTTIDLINKAGGLKPQKSDAETYNPDNII